ncbi:hypothetical protein F2Q69_00022091 [Brassica cretica]|uniref:Replication factor A C-terminal domain-containing protein n=1 Tax=Brassica cretica TaxID=69181 RepID=A0A8S9Q9B7_BRACR|nr:hypothetical protein F2Q69_00022091 [Brassica cretica]
MSIVARNVQHYIPINLLEALSETQKICVKIINKWSLYNSRAGNSIELVPVDASFGKAVYCVTIKGVDTSKNWYYWARRTCNLKVQKWYYLVVRAHDDNDETRFLIFNQIAENLLGISADHLMREYYEVSLKRDNNKFGDSPYVLDCYLDDKDIIDEWLENSSHSLQLTSDEDCSESSLADAKTQRLNNDYVFLS